MLAFIATLAVGAALGSYNAQHRPPSAAASASHVASPAAVTAAGSAPGHAAEPAPAAAGDASEWAAHRQAADLPRRLLLLIAAGLMAAVAYSILRQPLMLRREVEARTAELRASNEALARSTSLLRSASINGRVFPWEWDIRSDTLHWGVSPEDILGPHTATRPRQPDFRDMVHPDDLHAYLDTGRRSLKEGLPYYCEFRLVAADNVVRWIAARGEPVFDESNGVVRLVGASLDITERKRAEENLRQFSRAAEQINQGIMITDAGGRIEYVNPHFCQSTGYGQSEAIGRTPRLLASGQTPPEVYRHLWDTVQGGDTWRGELLNRRKDGSLYWESQVISPVRNDAGEITHFVAVKEDISARKEAEDEIQQLAAELAEKNRELESFSYTVSHDLRAPLRAIDGFVSLALDTAGDRAGRETREYLERAKAGAGRMSRLIEDMLDLARLARREMRREPVNLSRMAADIAAELRQVEPHRDVDFAIEDGLLDTADPVLMRNVLQNLLGNAWKFTRKTPHARIAFGRIAGEGAPRYFVMDNGAGFDMKFAGKLFVPFQRLHSQAEYDGTGVGLASVARILQRHGGGIAAHAAPGSGATFEFSLSARPPAFT
ncbi:MAG: Adaptive-response sensory-kinase SasA [Rhodocyclaceae bacterium]|nr:Adaptive-response sensory-kinase SasA [Rhodocyclaceae bacterium]